MIYINRKTGTVKLDNIDGELDELDLLLSCIRDCDDVDELRLEEILLHHLEELEELEGLAGLLNSEN